MGWLRQVPKKPAHAPGRDSLTPTFSFQLNGWKPEMTCGTCSGGMKTVGVENLRRILTDWLTDIGLIPAGQSALVGSYIGYYEPYATSHDDLDREKDFHEEVRNAARSLVQAVKLLRRGELKLPDASLVDPRQK